MKRLLSGDRDAFSTLYRWYADRLYRQVILPRLPQPDLAEDALRDTFRVALEKIHQVKTHDRSLFFWLRRIAINKSTDIHRRAQRELRLADRVRQEPEPQRTNAPDHGLEASDLTRMINLSLSRLNPRYAVALRMRLLEDRSRQECADSMGVSISTFDVLLHRAAKAFRQEYPP